MTGRSLRERLQQESSQENLLRGVPTKWEESGVPPQEISTIYGLSQKIISWFETD